MLESLHAYRPYMQRPVYMYSADLVFCTRFHSIPDPVFLLNNHTIHHPALLLARRDRIPVDPFIRPPCASFPCFTIHQLLSDRVATGLCM